MAAHQKEDEALETLLSDTESDIQHPSKPKYYKHRPNWVICIILVLAGAILSSSFWAAAIFIWSPHHHIHEASIHSTKTSSTSNDSPSRHCGASPSEARALGCKFQLWSYSWVPSPCFDAKLHSDFLEMWSSRENWGYFTKVNGGDDDEVSLNAVLAGDRNDLFSTWGQHYWHCAYYQRKFFRMMGEGGSGMGTEMMTNRDEDQHHAIHCQDWLANPFKYEWGRVNINLTVGYHSC